MLVFLGYVGGEVLMVGLNLFGGLFCSYLCKSVSFYGSIALSVWELSMRSIYECVYFMCKIMVV